jgi:7,8-dihydro-6-hydroxymethylpterin dimethyltransferase
MLQGYNPQAPASALPRDFALHSTTVSLCNHCSSSVSANIVLHEGRVLLHKRCPVHGWQEELLEEDADWYLARTQYDKPGTRTAVETTARRGCPHDCGLCPGHEQHTCIGVIEVTRHCDARCPTCYADAGDYPRSALPVARLTAMMDAFLAAEGGEAQILQISGGEPTTHPEILQVLQAARARPFGWVMLNTNGVRIADDPVFADALTAFRGRLEVYLQFDGFERRTHAALRGRDLREVKERAIARLTERDIPITLVMTASQGVNDGELGRVVVRGIQEPGVRGVNIQPVAFFGRNDVSPGPDRLTLSGVLSRIERQTNGLLRRADFVPLPCNVDRVAISYLSRRNGAFVPALRQEAVKRHLPLIDNTLMFDTGDVLRKTAEALASGQVCNCLAWLRDFLPLAPASLVLRSQAEQARFVTENTFRVTVTSFLDRFNFEARAMKKECVHVVTQDGRRIPFSAYNILHRAAEATP